MPVTGLGGQFHKAGIRAEKRVPFAIRLDALSPTDHAERNLKLLEVRARQLVESEVAADQQRTIGSIAKGGAGGKGDALVRTKDLKAIAVVAEDAVFRAHPKEANMVLIDLLDSEVVQAVCDPEIAEAVFLGV